MDEYEQSRRGYQPKSSQPKTAPAQQADKSFSSVGSATDSKETRDKVVDDADDIEVDGGGSFLCVLRRNCEATLDNRENFYRGGRTACSNHSMLCLYYGYYRMCCMRRVYIDRSTERLNLSNYRSESNPNSSLLTMRRKDSACGTGYHSTYAYGELAR